jgi:hypothetical protein
MPVTISSRRSKTKGEDRDWFKRTIEILTLLVITAGFILGIDQASKIRETIEEAKLNNDIATWNSVAEKWLEIDKIFVDHSEAIKTIFGDKIPKETYSQIAAANAVLDFMDFTISTYKNIIVNDPKFANSVHVKEWKHYFESIFKQSPVVCQILRQDELSYDPETRRMGQKFFPPETQ